MREISDTEKGTANPIVRMRPLDTRVQELTHAITMG